jgi:hypothetical protein
MSTTPPEDQQQGGGTAGPAGTGGAGGGYGYSRPGPTINIGALMPTPGNAEAVVWVLASIVLAIIALAADNYDAHGWADTFGWITAAYLLSRGIAKASRVLER